MSNIPRNEEDIWQPDLRNVIQPIPTYRLLLKAVDQLYKKQIIFTPLKIYRDKFGRWGFRFPQFIVVARDKPYGNILSVHREAVLDGMNHDIPILMWLESANKYYVLDPNEIFKNSETNYRGGIPFSNFNIELAKPLDLKTMKVFEK